MIIGGNKMIKDFLKEQLSNYLEAIDLELTEEQFDSILDDLMNDDYIFETIDNSIDFHLESEGLGNE